MSSHSLYKYSITCEIQDEIILACIRAICQSTAKGPYPQIGWGGTGISEWRNNKNRVIFRFSLPAHRTKFIYEANRLFDGKWRNITTNDNDPASPQR